MTKPTYVLYFYDATGRHQEGSFATKHAAGAYGDLLMDAYGTTIIRVEVRREDPNTEPKEQEQEELDK